MNYAMSYRLYGAAESGLRAFDVSTHKQGENYTIFILVGLNDLCYIECELAPTDSLTLYTGLAQHSTTMMNILFHPEL